MVGGEIYVKKIPSMKVTSIARAISPTAKHKIIGIRPGEKLHEQMIGVEDAPYTYAYDGYYKILPQIYGWSEDPARIKDGKKVSPSFTYTSDKNEDCLSDLRNWLEQNMQDIGVI